MACHGLWKLKLAPALKYSKSVYADGINASVPSTAPWNS